MTQGGRAWSALAALLATFAVVGGAVTPTALDWQPALAAREPWRAFSAVGVHYSALHLLANLTGTAVVAALGLAAGVSRRASGAWLAAWPLTQFGLLVEPGLAHFGGLSGVLHAGVLVVVVELLARGTRAQRTIGGLLLAGCIAKIALEAPWGPPLRHPADWDIATAPIAHLTGSLAGAACGLAALWTTARARRTLPRSHA